MQLETALRLSALTTQFPNVVKTFGLRATKVPKRTETTIATASARAPQTIPATACLGFVEPFFLLRVTAMMPKTAATRPPAGQEGTR